MQNSHPGMSQACRTVILPCQGTQAGSYDSESHVQSKRWLTGGSVAGGPFSAHQLQAAHEVQQGRGALKEHLNGCPKQCHLVEIQPKAAACQPQAVVQ